jgi:hypothetical protein
MICRSAAHPIDSGNDHNGASKKRLGVYQQGGGWGFLRFSSCSYCSEMMRGRRCRRRPFHRFSRLLVD